MSDLVRLIQSLDTQMRVVLGFFTQPTCVKVESALSVRSHYRKDGSTLELKALHTMHWLETVSRAQVLFLPLSSTISCFLKKAPAPSSWPSIVNQEGTWLVPHTALRKEATRRRCSRCLTVGAEWTRPTLVGWTPLIAAASHCHTDCLQFLIQRGANVGECAQSGQTAAHVAAEGGHLEVLLTLLDGSGCTGLLTERH